MFFSSFQNCKDWKEQLYVVVGGGGEGVRREKVT